MLAYATLGTNDLDVACKFYEEILAELGASRVMENERSVVWVASNGTGIGVLKPFDGKAASVGNGMMVSLNCSSPEQIDALHAKVLEMGGTDEGQPGFRNPGMYMAYWRDLDGNKLCFVHMNPDAMES